MDKTYSSCNNGRTTVQQELEKTRHGRFVDFDHSISKGQLEVRYRRYREQIATVEELLGKVSISVERLELENKSLREQNEYLLIRLGDRKPSNKPATVNLPLTAARAALAMTFTTVENLRMKIIDFEKTALDEATKTDDVKKSNEVLKESFQKIIKDLQEEKKKNDRHEERINYMENEFVKEATLRLAAERRYYSLEKEARELADELSAQTSQMTSGQSTGSETNHNRQQSSSDTEARRQQSSRNTEPNGPQLSTGTEHQHSPVSDVVITSTPNPTRSQRTAPKYFSKISLKRTAPKITCRIKDACKDAVTLWREICPLIYRYSKIALSHTIKQVILVKKETMWFDLKAVLSTSASITTILLFLSALPTAYKIIKRKSIGDDSCVPYTTAMLSCALWFMYGVLIEDKVIQVVNISGMAVQIICVNVFVRYSNQRALMALKQAAVVSLAIPVKIWALSSDDEKIAASRIGIVASCVSVAFFGAPLTKLMHVIRTASTECLPFPMITMSFIVSLQWVLYGLLLDDPFIVIPNTIGCTLSTAQLLLFMKYPSKKSEDSPKKNLLLI